MTSTPDRSCTSSDRAVVVPLAGELDIATAPGVRRRLDEAARRSAVVVADVSALTFLDAAGMSALVSVDKRLRTVGGRLLLRDPSDTTLRVLRLAGLNGLVEA